MTGIISAAMSILMQGEKLLVALNADTYTRRVPAVFNASIGGHYRHCLDHFACLLRDLDSSHIDYDNRQRDTSIEKHLDFALDVTRQLRVMLEKVPEERLEKSVAVRCAIREEDENSEETHSSIGRELVYCITHAIHHYALIAVIAGMQGIQLPKEFGVAPSTLAYQAHSRRV